MRIRDGMVDKAMASVSFFLIPKVRIIMSKSQEIINYTQLSKIKLKGGIFKSSRDPSVDLEREAMDFLESQKKNLIKKLETISILIAKTTRSSNFLH